MFSPKYKEQIVRETSEAVTAVIQAAASSSNYSPADAQLLQDGICSEFNKLPQHSVPHSYDLKTNNGYDSKLTIIDPLIPSPGLS